jgi:phosphomevalonate kinase
MMCEVGARDYASFVRKRSTQSSRETRCAPRKIQRLYALFAELTRANAVLSLNPHENSVCQLRVDKVFVYFT